MRRSSKRHAGAFWFAAVAATAAACGRETPREPADSGETAVAVAARPAVVGTIRAVIRASGVVVPAEGAEFLVVAPEPARLLTVDKAAGDAVASGEVLVRFDLAGADQELARQRTEVARAQADVETARGSLSRVRDFVARGLVPRVDLDRADRELADAQGVAVRAQTALTMAQAVAGRAVVRAPFDGLVVSRLHQPGDFVQPAATDPILRIVDPRRLDVLASIASEDSARVLPGASTRIVNPADGTSLPLQLSRGPGGTTGGTVLVRLSSSSPIPVPVDTTVVVEIDAEERTGVVFVDPASLLRARDQTVVMVASSGRAERRGVTTGLSTEERVEITSGLRPGELVITQGHVGLADRAVISVAVAGR